MAQDAAALKVSVSLRHMQTLTEAVYEAWGGWQERPHKLPDLRARLTHDWAPLGSGFACRRCMKFAAAIEQTANG